MSPKTLQDFEFKNQRVFLRLDLNVPLHDGQITDDTRIRASLPVLEELRQKGAKLVLASHLGRPKGEPNPKYSLEPVAERLSELLGCEVLLMDTPTGEAVKGLLQSLKSNQILLLENLRFDPGEEKNSFELAQGWASFTDIYVNDAFGASHREHASISALASLVEKKAMGPLIQKEVQALSRLWKAEDRPFAALLGGAKVSDKIGLIESLMDKVDRFLVGGAMAYTFLAALGISVGKSRIEKDKIRFAKDLMERLSARGKTLTLPVDHVTVTSLEEKVNPRVTESSAVGEDELAVDIGPKSRAAFAKALEGSRMVFWNGPMGIFEKEPFGEGTFAMARALASLPDTYKVVGGGDSVSAVQQSGLAGEFDHISTGGGASLEYLEAGSLPGIKALKS